MPDSSDNTSPRPDRGRSGGDRARDPRGGRPDRGPRRDSPGPGGDRGSRGPRREDERRDASRGRDRDHPPREERIIRPGQERAIDEPDVPEVDMKTLPFSVKAELKGLPKDLADTVAAHIIAAGELVDEDPDLAYRHAEAARRRAARLPVVREAAAETAYASGRYDVALREFRALRRMNGGDELVPAIADCERALGRPRDALELLEALPATTALEVRIEALLVEAGVRDDLGQRGESMRLLRQAISKKVGTPMAQARLRYAYANLLVAMGDEQGAREWFTSAAALDPEGELDTSDRLADLDGVQLPDTMVLEEEPAEDEPEGPAEETTATAEDTAHTAQDSAT